MPQVGQAKDATQRVSECFESVSRMHSFFNTPNTRQYTQNSTFHFTPSIIHTFATKKSNTNTRHVLTSRAVANLSLQRINQRQPSPSQCPKSNISFREFCTHALPASPKHHTTTSLHPLARHHRRCIASTPSASRHCLQSRIHEVVLPASASRAYHLQPRLSNDRRRHALAPGAFI